jgi:hypothetical protein
MANHAIYCCKGQSSDDFPRTIFSAGIVCQRFMRLIIQYRIMVIVKRRLKAPNALKRFRGLRAVCRPCFIKNDLNINGKYYRPAGTNCCRLGGLFNGIICCENPDQTTLSTCFLIFTLPSSINRSYPSLMIQL